LDLAIGSRFIPLSLK